MADLSLALLGPFQLTKSGQPAGYPTSHRLRALLAYLAVGASHEYPRETLAALLWPQCPDSDALGKLRFALSNLRTAIGDRTADPPFLLISRYTLQFNAASDHWLDTAAFLDLTRRGSLADLDRAIALYRGRFLDGISIGDSPDFEEWALLKREQFDRQMLEALRWSTAMHEERGDYEQAQANARKQLELDPWCETAHRQLMRALALSDKRNAALTHFKMCRRLLAEEMGAEPEDKTLLLVEHIRNGELDSRLLARPIEIRSPAQQTGEVAAQPVFVGREEELARLDRVLTMALAGQGQAVFLTGTTGSGKSALMREFVQRAIEKHVDIISVGGHCGAYPDPVDPLLPFHQILRHLTGDMQAELVAGHLSQEQAHRLRSLLPTAAQAIIELGPDLMKHFGLGEALAQRMMAVDHWPGGDSTRMTCHARLQDLLASGPRSTQHSGIPDESNRWSGPVPRSGLAAGREDLYGQFCRVVRVLAGHRPLILTLDDLQWADSCTIDLLCYLTRRLAGSRILLVAAYRPGDLHLAGQLPRAYTVSPRQEHWHPLESIVNELQRWYGEIRIDLDEVPARSFVAALLGAEQGSLHEPLCDALARETDGHPLLTIELLRGLQERGCLIQDEGGRWVLRSEPDWEKLPPRVEAVVGDHIGRLPDDWQEAVTVGSVQGTTFAAEVIASVLDMPEADIIKLLSGPLTQPHRLVQAQGLRRIGTSEHQRLSCYRFRLPVHRRYLYSRLDAVRLARLHEAVGMALEALCHEDEAGLAWLGPQLAEHFEAAGMPARAAHHLLHASRWALQMSDDEGASDVFQRELALLKHGTRPVHPILDVLIRTGLAQDDPHGLPELGARFLLLAERTGNPTYRAVAGLCLCEGRWEVGEQREQMTISQLEMSPSATNR